jgi:hypothetical protein
MSVKHIKCKKSQFKDKNTIKTKINSLVKSGQWSKKDKSSRIYYCETCKAWHMTSMVEGGFDPTMKPVDVTVTFTDRWDTLLKKDI